MAAFVPGFVPFYSNGVNVFNVAVIELTTELTRPDILQAIVIPVNNLLYEIQRGDFYVSNSYIRQNTSGDFIATRASAPGIAVLIETNSIRFVPYENSAPIGNGVGLLNFDIAMAIVKLSGNSGQYVPMALINEEDYGYCLVYDRDYYDQFDLYPTELEIVSNSGRTDVTKIIVEPAEQFFYKEVNQPSGFLWRDWCNIYFELSNGNTRLANIDEFTYSVSSSEITALTISPYDGKNSKFQIEYTRPDILDISNFTVSIQSVADTTLVATIRYTAIRMTSNIYTPGIGQGTSSQPIGGGGNFGIDPSTGQPVQSDDVATSLPGIGTTSGSYEGSVSNAGLFVHYAMNANMLKVVGDWLWATDLGLIIAKEVLSILYGSPIESAISLMSYPFNVTALSGVVSNQQELYWGAHAAGFDATAITNPYATIDWGTVQLTEFWGNFLDYAPHTKLELYLPWCTGFVPIDPNECLPGSLRVVTNIELAKGTCLHNVIGNDGRVIATHTGTCGKQLPLTALDTSGKALSLVSTAISTAVAGTAGAAANRAGEIAGANYMAGARQLGMTPSQAVTGAHVVREEAMAPHLKTQSRARNMALAGSAAATRTPSSVQRNGSFSGSTAGLGVQYPYLIISRPTQSVPTQYGHHYGYPSNIYAPLANLRGYTEAGEIHLTGFTCTEDELTEIDSLLKSGVIL